MTDLADYLDTIQCIDALELCKALPEGSIDMILTSPPYDNLRTYNGYAWNFEAIAHASYRVLKPGGVMVWIVNDSVVKGGETLTSMRQALYFVDVVGFKMYDTMIWDKEAVLQPANDRYYQVFEYMFILSKGSPNTWNPLQKSNSHAGKTIRSSSRTKNGTLSPLHGNRKLYRKTSPLNNVWRIQQGFGHSTTDRIAFNHPAIFPEELARRHILTWSNPGEVVLDFFIGSGTTAKMAKFTGRHYICGDISQEYVDLARERVNTEPFRPIVDNTTTFDDLPLFGGLEE